MPGSYPSGVDSVEVGLLGRQDLGGEVDATEGDRGVEYAHLQAGQLGRLCRSDGGVGRSGRHAVPVGGEDRAPLGLEELADTVVDGDGRAGGGAVGIEHVGVGLLAPLGAIECSAGHGDTSLLWILIGAEEE